MVGEAVGCSFHRRTRTKWRSGPSKGGTRVSLSALPGRRRKTGGCSPQAWMFRATVRRSRWTSSSTRPLPVEHAVAGSSCCPVPPTNSSIFVVIVTTPRVFSASLSPMSESRLARISVILFEPQDPVNIAATVRAMKNMGVTSLRLVRPVAYDPVRLEGIAHDTWDVIDAIEHYDDFDSAVADCVRLLGFTARRRAAKWQLLDPKGAADDALSHVDDGRVGIVF